MLAIGSQVEIETAAGWVRGWVVRLVRWSGHEHRRVTVVARHSDAVLKRHQRFSNEVLQAPPTNL